MLINPILNAGKTQPAPASLNVSSSNMPTSDTTNTTTKITTSSGPEDEELSGTHPTNIIDDANKPATNNNCANESTLSSSNTKRQETTTEMGKRDPQQLLENGNGALILPTYKDQVRSANPYGGHRNQVVGNHHHQQQQQYTDSSSASLLPSAMGVQVETTVLVADDATTPAVAIVLEEYVEPNDNRGRTAPRSASNHQHFHKSVATGITAKNTLGSYRPSSSPLEDDEESGSSSTAPDPMGLYHSGAIRHPSSPLKEEEESGWSTAPDSADGAGSGNTNGSAAGEKTTRKKKRPLVWSGAVVLVAVFVVLGVALSNNKNDDSTHPAPPVTATAPPTPDSPNAVFETKLSASTATDGDELGQSLALRGDTLVAGAVGKVVVFVRDSTNAGDWTEQAILIPSSNTINATDFGHSVAITAAQDTIFVAAPILVDGTREHATTSSPAQVYVFTRLSSTTNAWTEQAVLSPNNGLALGNQVGGSLAVDGGVLVVGANGDDENRGSTYVFVQDATTNGWTEQTRLTAADAAAGDFFGGSVGISGDTIVIGADQTDAGDGGIVDSGSVYIFTRTDSSYDVAAWTEQAKLTAGDAAAGGLFGEAVAISGDTIVVGAEKSDADGVDSGGVYVFVRSVDAADPAIGWTLQAKLSAAFGTTQDNFGEGVAISGNTIVVGADENQRDGRGSAHIFSRDSTGTWTEQAKLMSSDGGARQFFGYNVAISEDAVAVGADGDDSFGDGSGTVYVYNMNAL